MQLPRSCARHTHIHMHTVPRAAREMSMFWKTRLTVVITPSDCYT